MTKVAYTTPNVTYYEGEYTTVFHILFKTLFQLFVETEVLSLITSFILLVFP